jgi:LPS export ABC transporter protein LptC
MIRLLYIILVAGLYASCVNDLAEVNQLFEKSEPGVEVARDIEMLYSDSAIVRVRVIGATLVRHLEADKPRDEFPDGIHIDFLDPDGTVNSTLDAERADRYTRDKKVIARSDINKSTPVILQNNQGERLETSELIWDEARGQVFTEKFVKITRPEEIIYAYGFVAKQDFSEYELKRVVGRFKVEDKEFKN